MKLPESELEVMLVLWEESPLKTPEIMERLKSKNWSISTLQALLQRLEDKKAIKRTMDGRTKVYCPLISKEEYGHDQSSTMLQRFFHGSISSFVAHFAQSDELTQQDIDEIRAIIDRKGK